MFGDIEFSLAAGKAVDTADKLPLSMNEALNAISERLVEGTGRMLESVPQASQINLPKIIDKYNRALDHALDLLNPDEADKAVAILRAEIDQVTGIRGYELLNLIIAVGKIFAVRINLSEESEAYREFEERCGLSGAAEKLIECLRNFQIQQINAVRGLRENESIRPIRIAKQYIQRHFDEPITLEDVCSATGFSVSYFSALFKKETGEGFSRYLTRIRIEKAKALLQETNLSITEICDKVGYSDLKHFTGVFKKMTSLNPGQYRKLYG